MTSSLGSPPSMFYCKDHNYVQRSGGYLQICLMVVIISQSYHIKKFWQLQNLPLEANNHRSVNKLVAKWLQNQYNKIQYLQ